MYYTISPILVSCNKTVATLRGLILHEVQNRHIFVWERSHCFKFDLYVEGSCRYWFVLFVNFFSIHYRDTAVQGWCTFPAWFAPILHATRVQFSQSTIHLCSPHSPPILRLTIHSKLFMRHPGSDLTLWTPCMRVHVCAHCNKKMCWSQKLHGACKCLLHLYPYNYMWHAWLLHVQL